jgi:phosphoglycolate phosphatase-like HAD superfamily hydrolase
VVLESWNDTATRAAIVEYVEKMTADVPSEVRIATFDNDGTLWCEQPVQVQVFFLVDRVKQLAARDPAMKERQPFKALLEHDLGTLHGLGKQGLQELFAATHAGMIQEDFEAIVADWFRSATHPKFARPFDQLTFQPQLELLDYLRANGFRTFIVSGGGVDFMRVISEGAYGIAREQVVGSSGKLAFELSGGRAVLKKLAVLNSFDDREAKVQNIGLHIGRRPILAFGNSDGDLAMLRYVKTGPGPRLALLVHHDDAEREVAYDREFRLSPLVEALDKAGDYGITVVSIKRDWKVVFKA